MKIIKYQKKYFLRILPFKIELELKNKRTKYRQKE